MEIADLPAVNAVLNGAAAAILPLAGDDGGARAGGAVRPPCPHRAVDAAALAVVSVTGVVIYLMLYQLY